MTDYDQPDEDPIVAEVRAAREAIAAQFGYDLKAICDDARRRTEEAARAGRKVAAPSTAKPAALGASTKKAG
jgi:hypothetical protein